MRYCLYQGRDKPVTIQHPLEIPTFLAFELNPKVLKLFEIIQKQGEALLKQGEDIQKLRDEIAILKGLKAKPKINPSTLENEKQGKKERKKNRGGAKRSKLAELEIHETVDLRVPREKLPAGSQFKGHRMYTVQDIEFSVRNTQYRIERWLLPTGEYLEGELPENVCGHFGSQLRAFVLYQYHQCHVTQPLLLEELREFEIDISSGQLDRLLSEDKDGFHEEKEAILRSALAASKYIQADDTGARHGGQNGVCTHIGNEFFSWFSSTRYKSRINFLGLLRAGRTDYVFNEKALEYMERQKLPETIRILLLGQPLRKMKNEEELQNLLRILAITRSRHIRIITEGGLLGSLVENGLRKDLIVLSDDAGQFAVWMHALCWIHAERTVKVLIPFSDAQRHALDRVRDEIWTYYRELKAYQKAPSSEMKENLRKRFDEIFTQRTGFATLDCSLKRLYRNKEELLLVLEHPAVPLHNNGAEQSIREYVKRRKVSGGTRSSSGRQCRDTFTSLKKTCRKLGVSFWDYLQDRVNGANFLPYLPNLVTQSALAHA